MITKENLFRLISYIFLVVVFTGCLSTYESDSHVYIAVAFYLVVFALFVVLRQKIRMVEYPAVISLLMVMVWIYGFAVGIINGNDISMIIRNFAGMSVYLLVFPLLNSGISIGKYQKMIIIASNYALLITVFTYVMLTFFDLKLLFDIPVVNAFVGGGGIGGFVQYFCRELIHVSFAYNFYILLTGNGKLFIKSGIMLIIAAYATIVVNDSGGDALAMGVLGILIVLSQAERLKTRVVFFGIMAILALMGLYFYTGTGLLEKLFSPEDIGNARRIEEITYFRDEMTFFGHGLGKELGFAGSEKFNYGTEMIYLNLFHKFGCFALIILGCYGSTCIRAFSYLKNNNEKDPQKVIPLSLMAYLIPSLANPMLFSVLSVVSHILAMVIISSDHFKANSICCQK